MSMAIGGVSALGGDVAVKPLQYAVDNESKVSNAFVESMNRAGAVSRNERVNAAMPVRYPDARLEAVDQTERLSNVVAANRQYNNVASEFSNAITGYTANGSSSTYQTIGSNVDFYA